ncbi:MAG: lytic transglycosylase domain-containing protein [Thermoleophilaceae bacterium]
MIAAIVGAGAEASFAGIGPLGSTVRQIALPLKHEDIIRQQAAQKGLDPALIAAVIYEESHFRDQTSHAGARGLMQITPSTAAFIARDSGGSAFTQEDLATPQVNISYGAYYLRYLLRRYNGDTTLAIAAYNAGETNVNRWVAAAGGEDKFDAVDDVPFKETRDYVRDVRERRTEYRDNYASQLGL